MVDWTGQTHDATEQIQALARQRSRVAEVRSQVETVRRYDLPALHPVHWRSEAQRRYSDQLVELEEMLGRASVTLDRAVEALDQALRSAWSAQ